MHPSTRRRRRGEYALTALRLSLMGCSTALVGTLGMLAWRGLSGL